MSKRFTQALCRRPGRDLGDGITTTDEGRPDYDSACRQFDRYVETLRDFGLRVTVLDALNGFPDAHFIEDTAVVTPDVAVITHPGAPVRMGEQHSIAEALAGHRTLARIAGSGTLDGARQLGAVLESHGYTWQEVPVAGGLHFKSSVNLVGPDALLVTDVFAGRDELAGYRQIVVPSGEQYAANTLLINERLIMPKGYPATRARLEELGQPITELDTSEFRRMDGGLTCLSLRF